MPVFLAAAKADRPKPGKMSRESLRSLVFGENDLVVQKPIVMQFFFRSPSGFDEIPFDAAFENNCWITSADNDPK